MKPQRPAANDADVAAVAVDGDVAASTDRTGQPDIDSLSIYSRWHVVVL